MRAATVRRLLVFGVCALGVSCLYLVPSMARSPGQVGDPRSDRPLNEVAGPGTAMSASAAGGTSRPAAGRTVSATAGQTVRVGETGTTEPTQARPTRQTPTRTGATAFDPQGLSDDTPPDPVSQISFGPVTPATLTVTWAPAHDDVAVIGYRVWLNGFAVASTAETHVTINWFNDDASQHVVQVRAIDAAGNESTSSPNALVDRPTPSPTPTPTTPPESASPTPDPTPSPSPTSEQPTATPTEQPSGQPSPQSSPTASSTGQN